MSSNQDSGTNNELREEDVLFYSAGNIAKHRVKLFANRLGMSGIDIITNVEEARLRLNQKDIATRPKVVVTDAVPSIPRLLGTNLEQVIEKSSLNTVVQLNPGIPTISLLLSYYSDTIHNCFDAQAFDVVYPAWRLPRHFGTARQAWQAYLDQIQLAVKNADLAGTLTYNSGGEISLLDARKRLNYSVALLVTDDKGKPPILELVRQLAGMSYRVLPARNIDDHYFLLTCVQPRLSLLPIAALNGNQSQAGLQRLISEQTAYNLDSKILFISDLAPKDPLSHTLIDRKGVVDHYQRPGNVTLFKHLVERLTGNIDELTSIGKMTDAESALRVGMGFYSAWDTMSPEKLRSESEDTELLNNYERYGVQALLRFRELILKGIDPNFVTIVVNDLNCAEGALQITDPDKDYGDETAKRYLLKVQSEPQAKQAYKDWNEFFKGGKAYAGAFRTAEILFHPLPVDLQTAICLQEDLIGPNSVKMLQNLRAEAGENFLAGRLRDTIIKNRIDQYIWWRKHMPTLTSEGNYSAQKVAEGYKTRWKLYFKNFGLFSDIQIPQEMIEQANQSIDAYPWDEIVTDQTIMRYFSGTFWNHVIRTGYINISAQELIQKVYGVDSEHAIDMTPDVLSRREKEFEKRLYSVDHAARDAHYLEDVWEMLNFADAHLTEGEKLDHYEYIASHFEGMPFPFSDETSLVMNAYRQCREAGLYMGSYWTKLLQKHNDGSISDETFQAEKEHYLDITQGHIWNAAELGRRIKHPALQTLIGPLEECSHISELVDYRSTQNGKG